MWIVLKYKRKEFDLLKQDFRKILGVKKDFNPKGMGLFLNIYSQLKGLEIIDDSELDEHSSYFFNWLIIISYCCDN